VTIPPATVVAVAGDPGGANALGPVIELLRAQQRPVAALAYREARGVWAKRGLAFEELSETTGVAAAERRLLELRTERLLTATSFNGFDLEKLFIAASRTCGIPSLSVLDFWAGYRDRFSNSDGELAYLPDAIAVMDEYCRQEMIQEGFDGRHLHVTGQPAFDELEDHRQHNVPATRAAVRRRLEVEPASRLLVFLSQPLAQLFGADVSSSRYRGYTEHTVLASLIEALGHIAARRQAPMVLLIRPHPRERIEDLQMHKARATGVRILLDGGGDGRSLVRAADLVVGMTTVLLVEACLLGCVVVSLQPGLVGADVLPTNRWGASRPVYREGEIEPVVEMLLFEDAARAEITARTAKLVVRPGAARRVVDLLNSLPGLSVE
jgi:hypothetical protein